MVEKIKGKVVSISPTDVIVDTIGFSFQVQITLTTFDEIKDQKEVELFTHLNVKNEGQSFSGFELYGFSTSIERDYFQTVTSVSGIGTATARLMLSSLTAQEISRAILLEDVDTIKSVKGIGPKTAKRMILELKDKLPETDSTQLERQKESPSKSNTYAEEALSALTMLGFPKKSAQKAINSILKQNKVTSVEELVKLCLKKL